jgi:hypothetical protein
MKNAVLLTSLVLIVTGCGDQPKVITEVSGKVTDLILTVNPVPSTPVCPPKTFSTQDHAVHVLVRYLEGASERSYHALVGPESQVGLMENGALFICKGWVYVWEDSAAVNPFPWVQTAHVSAGADGCRFAVEVNALATFTNVYLFPHNPGDEAKVRVHGSATIEGNTDVGAYQHVEFGTYSKNTIATGSREQQKKEEIDKTARMAS